MCYHKEVSSDLKKVIKYFGIGPQIEFQYEPNFHINGFNFPLIPAIVEQNNRRVLIQLRWGLIPVWTKTWADAIKFRVRTLNSRIETAEEKSSFRNAIKKGHCIIPCTGFYEWYSIGEEERFPFYIHPNEGGFFPMAGFYESWTNKETAETLTTYSILTTEANPLMAKIHNSKKRMPVILQEKDFDLWLKNEDPLKQVLKHLAVPFDEEDMLANPISKLITSKENSNVSEIKLPFDYGIPEVMDLTKV